MKYTQRRVLKKKNNVEEFKNLLDLEIAPPSDVNGRVDAVVVPNDVVSNTSSGHHAAGADHGVAEASSGEGNQVGSQPIQEANENVGQITMFFRRVTCGIMDRIAATQGRQRVQQPPHDAAGGREAETTETQQPTENAARGEGDAARGEGEGNGTVAVVVVPNVAANTTAGHDALATDPGVATSGETPQPTENDEAPGGGEAAQQPPVNAAAGGREADMWRIELPDPDPRLSSILLRGVTSSGDGVLHIAARQGNLNLVIHICSRAGIRVQRVQQFPEDAALGAGEADTVGTQQPRQNGVRGEAEETSETQQNADYAAQHTLQFAEFLRAKNHKGETCLHEAVRSGCMDIVSLLIAVDAALDDVATPPLVQVLDDNGASPLYLATMTWPDIVKALTVPYKYQVSHAGPTGRTALHAAVVSCNRESCEVLLDWKSGLAIKHDESGRTPLHYACRQDIAITELILDKDPSSGYITDLKGSQPIHVAASVGRLDIIKKLLDVCRNCDSACDAAGRTFLHVAVKKGHANVVKYVCSTPTLTAILNMRDQNENTALHMAIRKGSWRIFCLLFSNNEVCLNSVNKQGRTPLDLAIMRSNKGKPNFTLVSWAWIRNDLLAARAGFGRREMDNFPFNSMKVVSKLDKEKESERLSKSAALLGGVIFLILSISLQAPFDVADKLHSGEIDSTHSKKKSTTKFGNFMDSDGMVLYFSTMCILCLTIAGFPYGRPETRRLFLSIGGFFLWFTVLVFLAFFIEGLSLVHPRGQDMNLVYFLVPAFMVVGSLCAVMMLQPHRVFAHVLARLHRLGFRRWRRSLSQWQRVDSHIPLMNVAFLVLFCSSFVSFVAPSCSELLQHLKSIQSKKTVI